MGAGAAMLRAKLIATPMRKMTDSMATLAGGQLDITVEGIERGEVRKFIDQIRAA
ncbi:MAG: hypothetical protein ACOYKM_12335 [Caulobacterales bacterium]